MEMLPILLQRKGKARAASERAMPTNEGDTSPPPDGHCVATSQSQLLSQMYALSKLSSLTSLSCSQCPSATCEQIGSHLQNLSKVTGEDDTVQVVLENVLSTLKGLDSVRPKPSVSAGLCGEFSFSTPQGRQHGRLTEEVPEAVQETPDLGEWNVRGRPMPGRCPGRVSGAQCSVLPPLPSITPNPIPMPRDVPEDLRSLPIAPTIPSSGSVPLPSQSEARSEAALSQTSWGPMSCASDEESNACNMPPGDLLLRAGCYMNGDSPDPRFEHSMHGASYAGLLSAHQTPSAQSSWLSGHSLRDLFASGDAHAGSMVESFSSTWADHIHEIRVQASIEGSASDLSDAQQVCLETDDILLDHTVSSRRGHCDSNAARDTGFNTFVGYALPPSHFLCHRRHIARFHTDNLCALDTQ
jgi:hypothetical protein